MRDWLRLQRNRAVWSLKARLKRPTSLRRLSKWGALERLVASGWTPATVIDVGVHQGTPELRALFADAKHVLVEPVREHEALIRGAYRKLDAVEYVWAAAAKSAGAAPLRVTHDLQNATLGPVAGERWAEERTREVELIPLDALPDRVQMAGPYLLKIDVDGNELDVLQGAEAVLESTDVVIVETALTELSQKLEFLESRGFFLWGVGDLGYKAGVLFQMDVLCLRDGLRTDPRFVPWLNPEGLAEPLATLWW